MAEAHPVGFRWAMKAREKGAKVIHVDPRFSRTSAMADMHVPIRAGSDIAFLGGLINHVLATESYFKEYVLAYTNASTIVSEDFQDTEDLGGLFCGFDATTAATTRRRGCTRAARSPPPAGQREHCDAVVQDQDRRGHATRTRSSATRRCSTRAASSTSSGGTTPATRRRWSSASAASRRRSSSSWPRR